MKCMQKGSAKQAGQPAEGALDRFFRRGRNGLVGKFGTVGVLHRPIGSGAGGGIWSSSVLREKLVPPTWACADCTILSFSSRMATCTPSSVLPEVLLAVPVRAMPLPVCTLTG